MLPAVLDPWASHALYEAAHLAGKHPGSKVWLVSLGPKAKLQQVMMTVAQKRRSNSWPGRPRRRVHRRLRDGGLIGRGDQAIPGLDRTGCWCSAGGSRPRAARAPRFRRSASDWGSWTSSRVWINHRRRGRLVHRARADRGWAAPGFAVRRRAGFVRLGDGQSAEPRNNPQIGMANMRTVMPALQKAKPVKLTAEGLAYASVTLPKQQRATRIVKDRPAEEIAREIVEWISEKR